MKLCECQECSAMVRDIEQHGLSVHDVEDMTEWIEDHEYSWYDVHVEY